MCQQKKTNNHNMCTDHKSIFLITIRDGKMREGEEGHRTQDSTYVLL